LITYFGPRYGIRYGTGSSNEVRTQPVPDPYYWFKKIITPICYGFFSYNTVASYPFSTAGTHLIRQEMRTYFPHGIISHDDMELAFMNLVGIVYTGMPHLQGPVHLPQCRELSGQIRI
jgi:hypothetical protein